MKSYSSLFPRLVMTIVLMIFGLAFPDSSAKASHCSCLHNATEKKDVTTYGAWAYITWTNPNLNGGQWSYHRAAVVQWSPWRFVEWGWQKISTGIRGLIAYNAGSGNQNVVISGVSAATHRYSMQYDPNNSKYWFYLDGSNVYNLNANFSAGNAAIGGGEVATGVEGMNFAKLYDVRYLPSPGGNFTLWNGHANYVDNSPYYNQFIDGNTFSSLP